MVHLSILPPGPVAQPGSTLAPPETQVDEEELCATEENTEESTSAAAEATTPETQVDVEELAGLADVETE